MGHIGSLIVNSPNLIFDGVMGSILNEEIRKKASGEGGSSDNMVGQIREVTMHTGTKVKQRKGERVAKVKAMT